MQITFLGTGTSQGVPVIACECEVCQSDDPRDKRLRTSVMVEVNGNIFVIDSGPDFRQQMLRENVKHLEGLIFTHPHKDHIAGMDDIRAFNYRTKKPVDIYADSNVQKSIRTEFHYIFQELKYPGVPDVNLHLITNEEFFINGVKIIPIEVKHYHLPVKGFRIGDFTYITDANYISLEEREKARRSKVLVLNALRREKHISHFTLEEAIALGEELEAEQLYLTHISHQMGKHADVSRILPPNVFLGVDGLKLTVNS
jgi:phosphoribosyl 1,2-cyclic phosphate phosphodiesterase